MKEKIVKALPYILIALVALASVSFFVDSNYIGGHDYSYHAASIEGKAGGSFLNIFAGKIYGVMANDLGYGEGLFYPPFTHSASALILKTIRHFGANDVYLAMKMTFFLILFFAGVFMRKLILLLTKNRRVAILSAFFYITFPYMLIDIIVRCAMAECALFMFMPLVLIGLYYLFHEEYKKFLPYFVIGCVGMIHSHLMMTLFFVGFCILGFLPSIKLFLKKKKIFFLALSIVITTLISLPFLLPMLENKAHTDYKVFEDGFMSNAISVDLWRVPIGRYLSLDGSVAASSDTPVTPVYISFIGLLAIIYAVFRYKKIKSKDNNPFLIFSIVIAILGLLCSTTLLSWEMMPKTLLLIQFPWRLLTFVALGSTIAVGLSLPTFEKQTCSDIVIAVIALSAIISIARVNSFAYNNLKIAVPATELKSLAADNADYLPTISPGASSNTFIRDYDPIKIVADNKDAVALSINNSVPNLDFEISNVSQKTTLTLPRIYYLGYNIEAEYDDGSKESLPYEMSEHGFINIYVDKDAKIRVTYPGTKLQRISYWVASLTTVASIIFCIYLYKRKRV